MKNLLLTTLMLAMAVTGMAQNEKRGMNSLVEDYTRQSEDTLVVYTPNTVIITKDSCSYTVNIKGEYNSYLYDINIKNTIEPSQYLVIKSNGIEFGDNDTIQFLAPESATFSKNSKENRFTVKGSEGSEEYSFSIIQSGNIKENKTVYKATDSSWNFEIPFINKKESIISKDRPFCPHSDFSIEPTFGMGLVSATGQGEDVDLAFSNGSFEFILDDLVVFSYFTTRRSSLNCGFGLNWRNYRMTGNKRFIKDIDGVSIGNYPDNANVKFSRIKIFSLTLSFLYKYRFNDNIGLGLGPIVCFNTGGNIKTRWSVDGEPAKDRQYNIRQTPVTVDFKALIYVKPFSLYFKYSPCNVLTHDRGPAFRSMSAGILFGF